METRYSRERFYPLINGFIQSIFFEFFSHKNFNFFSVNLISEHKLSNKNINFVFEEKILELNSSNAIKVSALSAFYNKVWTLSKTFRNEKDISHLFEFSMLECEWKVKNEDDIFNFIEELLCFIVDKYNSFLKDNNILDLFDEIKIELPLKRISYEDALTEFKKTGQKIIFDKFNFCDADFSSIFTEPTFVTDYPSCGAWRAKRKNQEKSYLYNLILPNNYGELVEFSIRETKVDFYKQKFMFLNILNEYEWYISALENDESPRGGFGLGIERLCSYLMQERDLSKQILF